MKEQLRNVTRGETPSNSNTHTSSPPTTTSHANSAPSRPAAPSFPPSLISKRVKCWLSKCAMVFPSNFKDNHINHLKHITNLVCYQSKDISYSPSTAVLMCNYSIQRLNYYCQRSFIGPLLCKSQYPNSSWTIGAMGFKF